MIGVGLFSWKSLYKADKQSEINQKTFISNNINEMLAVDVVAVIPNISSTAELKLRLSRLSKNAMSTYNPHGEAQSESQFQNTAPGRISSVRRYRYT